MRSTGRAPAPATASAPQVSTHTAPDGVQHRGDPLHRMGPIHRHIHPTGLDHRPPGHHQLHTPIHRHAHRALRTHPRLDQHPRQPRRPLIKLAIRHRRAPSTTATASGSAATAAANNCRRHPHRRPHPSTRPPRQHQITLTAIQQRHLAHHHRGIGHHRLDHPPKPADQPLDGGPVEQIRGIGHHPGGHRRARILAVGTSLSWISRSNLAVRVTTASGSTLTPSSATSGRTLFWKTMAT